MNALNDATIVRSWHANADPWTAAVREGRIESRRRVTDAAVVSAILQGAPRTVLDIGCGEGWLSRALAAQGLDVTGVDAVPRLVEAARLAGGGRFLNGSYEDVAAGRLELPPFDAAVCNFSLLGDGPVRGLFEALGSRLAPGGTLIVQTLHPLGACGDLPYEEGWRPGSWAGFGPEFSDPAPWYFRTLGGWLRLLRDTGWALRDMQEPLHPDTGRPVSVIFVAQCEQCGAIDDRRGTSG